MLGRLSVNKTLTASWNYCAKKFQNSLREGLRKVKRRKKLKNVQQRILHKSTNLFLGTLFILGYVNFSWHLSCSTAGSTCSHVHVFPTLSNFLNLAPWSFTFPLNSVHLLLTHSRCLYPHWTCFSPSSWFCPFSYPFLRLKCYATLISSHDISIPTQPSSSNFPQIGATAVTLLILLFWIRSRHFMPKSHLSIWLSIKLIVAFSILGRGLWASILSYAALWVVFSRGRY